MDKRSLPPWMQHLWNELTKPPAVLHRPTTHMRKPRQNPQNEMRDEAEDEDFLYDSPTDPPFTGKSTKGNVQAASKASRKYFVPRKTNTHRTMTKPRPRKTMKTPKRIQQMPLTQGVEQVGQPRQQPIQTMAAKTASQPERTLRTSQQSKTKPETKTAERYFEQVHHIEPTNGVWKITVADSRQFALKESKLSPARITFMADALDELHRRGFKRVARIIRTARSNKPYLIDGAHTYYVSEWVPGLPVQLASMRQLNAAAKSLARFHERSQNYESGSFQPPHAYRVFEHLLNRKQDLTRLYQTIEHRSEKNSFDELFLHHFAKADKQATDALSLCKLPEVESHLKQAMDKPGLCHLDVTRSNLIVHPAGFVQLIDFDTMTFGPRAVDLAHLLRRAMQAQGTWSNEIALVPLIAYNRVQPLVQGEYLLLESLLTFPHRFWRIAHTYYGASPQSTESYHLQLKNLQDSLALENPRDEFLSSFSRQVTRRTHS